MECISFRATCWRKLVREFSEAVTCAHAWDVGCVCVCECVCVFVCVRVRVCVTVCVTVYVRV
jgi:hypothetical protein